MKRTSPQFELQQKPQAWKTYKRIVRLIRGAGLRVGDRLPTQPEMCKALDVCTNTLKPAMEALIASGAIISKKKIGTVIADEDAMIRVPWTIGVATGRREDANPELFNDALLIRILAALGRSHCKSMVYHRQWRFLPTSIKDYFGLPDDIACGAIDGLVLVLPLKLTDWRKTEAAGVPICYTHHGDRVPCGVLIDQKTMAEHAVAQLVARGCRRIAAGTIVERAIAPTSFWDGFDRGIQNAGLPASAGETLIIDDSIARGVPEAIDRLAPALARGLLNRPPAARPDGLVIPDDYVASQLTAILRRAGYRPLIAVQTNRQLPRAFALPIISFEVDIDAMARQAADLILRRVWGDVPQQVEMHVPRFVQTRVSPRSSRVSIPIPAAHIR